ncbi:MAG: hypothetical protein NT014_07570 [Candidatus Omnitrophica bacterium]|nr:hypothetical protein [Candidatus Omnitrophota bacterium]
MKLRLILLALLFVFICSSVSFAAIIMENRTGAVKIFMPDGKQIVVQANEPLPAIPDGATITILAGSATVNTTGKSTVSVSIGTYTVQIKEDSKINLTLNPDGTMTSTVIAGQSLVSRKVEAYERAIPPAGFEFHGPNEIEEISHSH